MIMFVFNLHGDGLRISGYRIICFFKRKACKLLVHMLHYSILNNYLCDYNNVLILNQYFGQHISI